MTTNEGFKSFCRSLNECCMMAQDTGKEQVDESTAVKALYIVKYMKIGGLGDALLYSTALNVLNTYVKQDNGDRPYIGYFFKKYANYLADYLINNAGESINLELQEDRGMSLLVVDLFGIQCSYHRVNIKSSDRRICHSGGVPGIKWDGVRKQSCANTLFYGALANTFGRTDRDIWGNDLLVGMNGAFADYLGKRKTIREI